MKTITEQGIKYINITDKKSLDELIEYCKTQKPFADKFKFSNRKLFVEFLETFEINYEEFIEKYFYYNSAKKIHIAESNEDYFWISTAGLVPKGKSTDNKTVNACLSQYLVLKILFDKTIELVENESVYNIDSYCSEKLTELSPALYHNITFYIEVFCKAYLSLTQTNFPFTHSLPVLYKKTKEIMKSKNHDNSLFQILVLDRLYNFVNHIDTMPSGFKEHNIKYNDNPLDDSVILFDRKGLMEMEIILELSIDFIQDFYYLREKTHYLENNVFQRMIDRADSIEKKNRIKELYPHLANQTRGNLS